MPYRLPFFRSYHIILRDSEVAIWPMCSFGDYCLNKKYAKQKLSEMPNPERYRLISYRPVIASLCGAVVGVTGPKRYESD